jgi:hypothetical protein
MRLLLYFIYKKRLFHILNDINYLKKRNKPKKIHISKLYEFLLNLTFITTFHFSFKGIALLA